MLDHLAQKVGEFSPVDRHGTAGVVADEDGRARRRLDCTCQAGRRVRNLERSFRLPQAVEEDHDPLRRSRERGRQRSSIEWDGRSVPGAHGHVDRHRRSPTLQFIPPHRIRERLDCVRPSGRLGRRLALQDVGDPARTPCDHPDTPVHAAGCGRGETSEMPLGGTGQTKPRSCDCLVHVLDGDAHSIDGEHGQITPWLRGLTHRREKIRGTTAS